MPRKARRMSEYGFMHIIVRGIGRQLLFEDKSDYGYYLKKLEKYCMETEVKVCAYCLMDNHVHLLAHGEPEKIVLLMKKIGVSYAGYYNKKYDRAGHLFQDRYISEPVEDDLYLLTVFRYILQNPQKAGICNAAEYLWSSYGFYENAPDFMDLTPIWNVLGSKDNYEEFIVTATNNDKCLDYKGNKRDDEWAIMQIKGCLGIPTGTVIQTYDKAKRDSAIKKLKDIGLSVRQIVRLTGIGRGVVLKAGK